MRKRAFFALLLGSLLLLIMGVASAQTPPICAACGEPIIGGYIEIAGKPWHRECVVCAQCGKPIAGQYGEKDGRLYHPRCYEEALAPRCVVCDKPIVGEYVSFEGGSYHNDCYRDRVAARCTVCREPITGPYIEDNWGNRIHAEHQNSVQRCSSCMRFLAPGKATHLTDGRSLCPDCWRSGVRDVQTARRLMREASTILASHGISFVTKLTKIDLQLVDKAAIETIGGLGGDTYGLHEVESKRTTDGRVVVENTSIYLVDNLPEEQALAVLAHELFHVWQHERGADGGTPAWREGSANVASWLALQKRDTPLARFLIKNMEETLDSNYGTGYRRARTLYESQGKVAFLDRVLLEGRKKKTE